MRPDSVSGNEVIIFNENKRARPRTIYLEQEKQKGTMVERKDYKDIVKGLFIEGNDERTNGTYTRGTQCDQI